jgi:zinc protease
VSCRLRNGARIVVLPTGAADGAAPVAIQLWVMAGAAFERGREHGCAHLLEHMLFKPHATQGVRPLLDIATAIETIGGDVNAYTSHDETVFYATVPARDADRGIDGLVIPVLRPTFDRAQLVEEAQVVVEEIRQYRDDRGQGAADDLMVRLFDGRSYGRSVLGTERSVLSHGVARLRAFHERAYAGDRLALVVVGPVDARQVIRRARRIMRTRPPATPAARAAAPRSHARIRARIRRDDVHEAHVLLGWRGPPFSDRDACALEVAAVVLGHGEASRLVRETRRRDQLVSDVHATCYAARGAGSVLVSAHTTASLAAKAGVAVREQVERLTRVVVDGEEMARARAVLESDRVYRRETVQGQAHALGYSLSLTGELDGDRRYYAHLSGLTPDDVRRACATYLRSHGAVVSMVLPRQRIDAARARAVRAEVTRALGRRSSRAGARTSRGVAHRRSDVWCVDLESGIRIRVKTDVSVPMAAGWLVWRGGLRLERARDAGASTLLGRLLTRGTSQRDGDALAREIEGMAGLLEGFSGRNSLGLHFESLAPDFPTILRRALECAREPAFPAREVEEERRVSLQELAAQDDDLGQVAVAAGLEELYGSHPLGRPRLGTRESLEHMTRGRLRRLWRREYPLDRVVLAAAGDLDVDGLVELVQCMARGAVVAAAAEPRWPAGRPRWPDEPRTRFIRRRRAQAHVALAYPGLAIGDVRAYRMDVLMTVLGGHSGRLFAALREDRGLVYGVAANSAESMDAGHVMVHASTSQDKLVRAWAAIEHELDRTRRELVPGHELDRAKAWLVGQHVAGLQRRSRVASHLAFGEAYGLGHSAYRKYVDAIDRVTAVQVRELARAVLDPRQRALAVVAARKPALGA